ncbi:DUF3263 domain-containing protein [Rhodococcus sp. LB1]|uniref:DUF3263 domain-containing protein n=1 Tax=Rhodococcus sp. LB1 TaxID=1807499 RepID=UPI0018D29D36|nr:DUF3263 domain-containing protein [Rhodococcus sp. LB1]
MSKDEQYILDFARRWTPFGGPSAEEIMVNLGMTPARYRERLRSIVDEPHLRGFRDPVLRGKRIRTIEA